MVSRIAWRRVIGKLDSAKTTTNRKHYILVCHARKITTRLTCPDRYAKLQTRGSRFTSVNARIVLRYVDPTSQSLLVNALLCFSGRLLRLERGLKFSFVVKLFELSLSLGLAEVYFTFLKDMKMRFTTLSLHGLRILPRSWGPTSIFTFDKVKGRQRTDDVQTRKYGKFQFR